MLDGRVGSVWNSTGERYLGIYPSMVFARGVFHSLTWEDFLDAPLCLAKGGDWEGPV